MINKISKETILKTLEECMGIVTICCSSCGISRTTFYNYLKEDLEFKSKVDEIENVVLDFAENSLLKQIKAGDTTATIFYLKTKGKKRGYIEKQELQIEGVKEVTGYCFPDGTVMDATK